MLMQTTVSKTWELRYIYKRRKGKKEDPLVRREMLVDKQRCRNRDNRNTKLCSHQPYRTVAAVDMREIQYL